MSKKLTQEQVIMRFREVHGDKYDYSKVLYVKYKTKVCIICPKHGEFFQTVGSHLNKRGCPICGKISTIKKNTKDTKWFIEKAKEIHGNKFLYDKSIYTKSENKITITCKKHGDFEQMARNHLSGQGCPRCKAENISIRQNKTTGQFIQQAKKIHGNKYVYDLVVYTKKNNKVRIICPQHGIFEQTPNSHLCGTGCPHCKSSKGEEKIAKYLTRNKIDFIRQFHILPDNLFCTTCVIIVDFYLPKNKVIIEFNGEQHYKPIKHFGGDMKFKKQQGRDFSLKLFCKHHKIKLIEIPYTNFDDIENILKRELKIKR